MCIRDRNITADKRLYNPDGDWRKIWDKWVDENSEQAPGETPEKLDIKFEDAKKNESLKLDLINCQEERRVEREKANRLMRRLKPLLNRSRAHVVESTIPHMNETVADRVRKFNKMSNVSPTRRSSTRRLPTHRSSRHRLPTRRSPRE